MILISLIYGFFTGRFTDLSSCILAVPIEGLDLGVTLVFTSCFFNGIMMILFDAGFIDTLSKILFPFLNKIMPNLKNDTAKKYIAINIIANSLNLGFAATPAGLKAMKELKKSSSEKDDTASDEMVTFLILNTAGLTILPTSIFALRIKYGSTSPSDFLPYAIIGTFFSILTGLVFDYLFRKRRKKK